MVISKLTCPGCGAVLKPNKPVPNGVAITCPQCRKLFRAGAGEGAIHSGPAPIASLPPGPPIPAAPPRSPALALPPGPSNPPSGNGMRLALVLGGLILLAVLGGLMLWLLTSGGTDPERTLAEGAKEPDKEGEGGGGSFSPDTRPSRSRTKTKPLIDLNPEEEKIVKEMTDRGVSWLRKTQRPDGTWAPYTGHPPAWTDGMTSMAGLTLLSCEVKAEDEAVRKAARHIRARGGKIDRTYEVALAILFLDKLNDPADKGLLETLTYRLIAGQKKHGGWWYECGFIEEKDRPQVALALRQLAKQGGSLLQEAANPDQEREAEKIVQGLPPHLKGLWVFSKPPEKPGKDFWRAGGSLGGDNSNTQFAVLALWAARKHGLPVDRSLEFAVKRFKESQNPDGSWNYEGHRNAVLQPTMTCAGLLAMAVEYGVKDKDALKGPRPEDNPAIKKAIDHVSRTLVSPKDEKAKTVLPPLYFLWSVERVGVLFQLPKIGDKDWYRWGMRILHDHQLADGSWPQSWRATTNVADTCFALLFLNRVNLSADLTDQLRNLGP